MAAEEDRRALERLEIEHAALEEPRGVEEALGWMSGICASHRSGTTMLCRALTAISAGRPQGYFLAEDPAKLPDRRFWEERQR